MNYILKKKTKNKLNSLNNLKKYYISFHFEARRKQEKNIEFIDINEQCFIREINAIITYFITLSDFIWSLIETNDWTTKENQFLSFQSFPLDIEIGASCRSISLTKKILMKFSMKTPPRIISHGRLDKRT